MRLGKGQVSSGVSSLPILCPSTAHPLPTHCHSRFTLPRCLASNSYTLTSLAGWFRVELWSGRSSDG